MKVITELVDTFVCQVSIEMSPGKELYHIALGLWRLHNLHDMEVGHILVGQLGLFGHKDFFLGNHHSFLKKESILAI